MNTHTPGPWTVHEHSHINGEFWCSIGKADGFGPISDIVGEQGNHTRFWEPLFQPVAGMKYLVTPVEEQRANARLIAAAPELLEQLRKADQVIIALWALAQKHGIPDEAEWPMLGELQRKATIARAESR